MEKIDIDKIDKDLHVTPYTRNQSKAIATEIRDMLAKVEIVSSTVRDGYLDPELYETWVNNIRIEIKDSLANMYSYLQLEETTGRYDEVFLSKSKESMNKYRGKRVSTGEWIYGYLIGSDVIVGEIVEFNDEYFNTEFWYKVDPDTVEQCIELK